MANLILIDLSSIAHGLFAVSGTEPDPDWTAKRTIARVHALTSGQPHAAICCDAPPYFRKEIDPTYKANRDREHVAVVGHQIDTAIDALRADGFPIWKVKGFEADDIIATAVRHANTWTSTPEAMGGLPIDVLVATQDKDLCQLISDRVKVKSLKDGSEIGIEECRAKFKIEPHQMVDYLALVGDKSDNIIGCKGVGAVNAAKFLNVYGNLDDLFAALDEHPSDFTPAAIANLREFQSRMDTVRSLIRLRTDAPIDFDAVFKERVPMQSEGTMTFSDDEEPMTDETPTAARETAAVDPVIEADAPAPVVCCDEIRATRDGRAVTGQVQRDGPDGKDSGRAQAVAANLTKPQAMTALVPDVLPPYSEDRRFQLEPRNYKQLKDCALDLFASRHFMNFGSQMGVMATIAAGREHGIPMMASLRAFHIIDGKPAMSSDLIRALVLQSPVCEYFRIKERTAERATWVAKRKGDPEVELTFTIEEGRAAFAGDDKAWRSSNWFKRPANMVTKTASSMLARLVFPDITMNLYSVEELGGEESQ